MYVISLLISFSIYSFDYLLEFFFFSLIHCLIVLTFFLAVYFWLTLQSPLFLDCKSLLSSFLTNFFPYRNENLLFLTVLEICPDWLMKKLANACLSNLTLFLSSDAVWKMSMSEKIWEGALKCKYNIFVWSFTTQFMRHLFVDIVQCFVFRCLLKIFCRELNVLWFISHVFCVMTTFTTKHHT